MRLTRILICWAALFVFGGPVARAASVAFGSATTIAGDSDVSTAGTLVAAFRFGNSDVVTSSVTVNGVQFDPFTVDSGTSVTHGSLTASALAGSLSNSSSTGSGSAPFSSLNANYQTLLSNAVIKDTSSGPPQVDLTFSGLSIGTSYAIQLWVNDSQATTNAMFLAGGNFAGMDPNTTNAVGGVGQYILGTFTADFATQTVGVNGNPGLINAVQLRSAVPEPVTLGLLTTAASLLFLYRGHRYRRFSIPWGGQ
jgi:hypothetical protein